MTVPFRETGPPADGEALAELERRAGHPLAEAHRAFLEHHDGAVPERNHLPDGLAEGGVAVRHLYSTAEIHDALDQLGPDRVPPELLPMSDDDFGNGLFVHLEDGSVWSWDHELEDEDDLWAAFTREADDLDELLDRLEPLPDELDDVEPEPLDEGFIDLESFGEQRDTD